MEREVQLRTPGEDPWCCLRNWKCGRCERSAWDVRCCSSVWFLPVAMTRRRRVTSERGAVALGEPRVGGTPVKGEPGARWSQTRTTRAVPAARRRLWRSPAELHVGIWTSVGRRRGSRPSIATVAISPPSRCASRPACWSSPAICSKTISGKSCTSSASRLVVLRMGEPGWPLTGFIRAHWFFARCEALELCDEIPALRGYPGLRLTWVDRLVDV